MQYILTIRPGIPIECRQKIEAVLKEFKYCISGTWTTVENGKYKQSDIKFEDESIESKEI